MDRHQAIIEANHVRLRPILMTTISIIAGMLPIAFGRGAGSGSRASMATTIIGGQMLCLLLTLLVTPVVYSYFDGMRTAKISDLVSWMWGRARKARGQAATTPAPSTPVAVPAEQRGV
jgi:HAE1 family hydrophobic/amphiphilic exporter-1